MATAECWTPTRADDETLRTGFAIRSSWRRRGAEPAPAPAPPPAASPPAAETPEERRQRIMAKMAGVSADTPPPPRPTAAPAKPAKSAARTLIGGSIPRLQWDDDAVAGYLKRGEPVVLTGGCPLISSLVGRWNFDTLAEGYGAFKGLSVHFAPRETTTFHRHYGKGLGSGGCTNMSFERFASRVRSEHLDSGNGGGGSAPPPTRPMRYYLVSPMIWRERASKASAAKDAEARELEMPGEGVMRRAPFGPALEADVQGRIGWEWLARARALADAEPFDTCQLWAGHGGGSTPLHFDSLPNFLAQVQGRKQVLVFPPSQTWNLYPYPVGHPMDNFAMVDVEEPDFGRFPALVRAKGVEAVLEPGDVLWLPRFHWHYVHQLDAPSENLSLNFWIGKKGTGAFMREMRQSPLPSTAEVDAAASAANNTMRTSEDEPSEDSRLKWREMQAAQDENHIKADRDLAMKFVHAGRMAESAAASVMGNDKQRGDHFLAALAAGAEDGWKDKTSNAAISARKIRGELMAVLGGQKAANALLRVISRDGRLFPGLAPKMEGTIVNSESGDKTSEEEVRAWFGADD